MIEAHLQGLLRAGLQTLTDSKVLDVAVGEIELTRPAKPEHGEFSSNLALVLAKSAGLSPRDLADKLVTALPESELVTKVDIAGPGFINFHVADSWLHATITQIIDSRQAYGQSDIGRGTAVNIEFVSANPTGPIHVGSGRNAAYGDALGRLLEAVGYKVTREYYVNDHGTQMDRFALSLEARYRQALGHDAAVPEDGYHGEYLIDMGKQLAEAEGMGWIGRLDEIKEWGVDRVLASHRATLDRFNVHFDNWFSESTLHRSGKVKDALERLSSIDFTFEKDGATWLKASAAGAPRDQVLIRSDGRPTYLAVDIAYLLNKIDRGFEKAIYVWGADHHGNKETLVAAARALGYEEAIEILLYQLVNFSSEGESVRMAKRTGDIVTLDELIDDVGVDAARYTLLIRSTDSTIDFDFDLVKSESQDNPVYYVQYQHARISSILRYATEQGIDLPAIGDVDLSVLKHESEISLIKKLSEYPDLIESSARLRAPFRITNYMQILGMRFSSFYRDCRVITDDTKMTHARLFLSEASRQVMANGFRILGVSAPESM